MWVIGILLSSVVGYITLEQALAIVLLVGVILHVGFYLAIRAIASHLKLMKNSPEKEKAHDLMMKIICRRIFDLCKIK